MITFHEEKNSIFILSSINNNKFPISEKTVHLIMARAKKAMKENGSNEWRIIFKGHNTKTLYAALEYFDGSQQFQFLRLDLDECFFFEISISPTLNFKIFSVSLGFEW